MTGPQVVIVGGGIVGASVADELSARGWTDVTLVEAGTLPAPGGSTSHAPGVVFQTNATKVMSDLARYTVQKFSGLTYQGEPCYLPVGGVEIATTPERLAELHRRYGFAQSWGIPDARLLSVDEVLQMWDLLDPARVLGGLYVPTDGIAKAVNAVGAQVERAQSRGVTVLDHCEVLDVAVETAGNGDRRVTGVETTQGFLPAEIVLCCAGIWGPKVARMVGMNLPLTPLAHQLAWTKPLAALAGQESEATRPVLRHQDAALYYRERYDGLAIGSYHHRAMPLESEDLRPWGEVTGGEGVMPSVLPFTPEDFAFPLAETAALIPAAADLELDEAINGVFSFTTDNLPLLGPSPDVEGFWVAEAVWVTHSGGVGKAMAEWLVDGHCSSFDLHACDVNRFERHQLSPAYVLARDSQNFVEVYDIIHPLQPMASRDSGAASARSTSEERTALSSAERTALSSAERTALSSAERTALRPLRTSPFYPRQQALGGVFLEANGWERPHWYAANDALVDSDRNPGWSIPKPDPWAAQYWSPTVAAEAAITRSDVAMYDMTALKRLEVSGPGATDFLQGLVTANIAKTVGGVTYCLLLDTDGGIRSDITVARLAPERYQVGANGALDQDWLRRHLPAGSPVSVRDLTAGTCCIGLWGPRARDLVQPLTRTDFSHDGFRYFRAKQAYLGTVDVTAMRLSYVGELGWELYTTADQGLALWDLLMEAGRPHGIIAAGRGAFNSLRIEKGYRSFGTDMTHEHDPYEAGLAFAVKPDREFLGRAAMVARSGAVQRRLVLLTLDGDSFVVGSEPVYAGVAAGAVGYITSASWSYSLGQSLAYAWLPAASAAPGTRVEIGYFDRRYPAVVTEEPGFDPEMKLIRR